MMNRVAFVLRVKPGKKEAFYRAGEAVWPEAQTALDSVGMKNFSVWSICDFMFCYGETPDGVEAAQIRAEREALIQSKAEEK